MDYKEENEQKNKKSIDMIGACSYVFAIASFGAGAVGTTTGNQKLRTLLLLLGALFYVILLSLAKYNSAKTVKIISAISLVITGILLIVLIFWQFPNIFPEFNEALPPPPEITATPTPEPTQTPEAKKLTHTLAEGKIAAGYDFTILLREDGTVVSFGGKAIDTSNWENIIQVAGYGDHALGLCENGAVVSTGLNVSGECDVSSWENVKQISASYQGTIAVTNDGRVLYTGFDRNGQSSCTSWTNMDKILGGEDHILGLKRDGTVVASGYNGDKRKEVSGFKDVIAGDAANGSTFIVLKTKDNDNKEITKVKTIGANWANEDNVGGWTDIIDVSGGDEHTVGLRSDGSVVCSGMNDKGQCNLKDWKNVVAIVAGQFHTVGLCADGSLVATGQNHSGECNVSGVSYWVN